jgi:hypothetical protein
MKQNKQSWAFFVARETINYLVASADVQEDADIANHVL